VTRIGGASAIASKVQHLIEREALVVAAAHEADTAQFASSIDTIVPRRKR
jgi:hypothetical protein